MIARSHLLTAGLAALGALAPAASGPLWATASLVPSRSALLRQAEAADEHGYPRLAHGGEVRQQVEEGFLVHLPGNADYEVKEGLRYPYARPEVRLFVEEIARAYRDVCGEKLVVTSLVRPRNRQPRNSSPLSVHPTGMAMDLRRSWSRTCRGRFEAMLLHLEEHGVLEAALEANPPHYHVALFPQAFTGYLAALPAGAGLADRFPGAYRVQRGDTVGRIARLHGTSVEEIQRANGMRSTFLRQGQLLRVPGREPPPSPPAAAAPAAEVRGPVTIAGLLGPGLSGLRQPAPANVCPVGGSAVGGSAGENLTSEGR